MDPMLDNCQFASSQPIVLDMQTGLYEFEPTVTDNRGGSSKARVKMTVLAAPAETGSQCRQDFTIAIPATSADLNGRGSHDEDGRIASYTWKQVSGRRPP